MVSFFKSFGKGILYVLVLPVLILILGVYAVLAFLGFAYLTIKSLILFFTGRSLFDDLPEDKKAKAIIKANTINPDDYIPEGDMPAEMEKPKAFEKKVETIEEEEQTVENDPFYVPEYLKSEPEETMSPETPEPEEDLISVDDILYVKHEVPTPEESVDVPISQPSFDARKEEEEKNWMNDEEELRL